MGDSDQESASLFAVVTGASSGIGLELAKQLGELGHDLLIVSETDTIHTAASEISAGGANVDALVADLSTSGGVDALVQRIKSSGREIDVLALNAGVGVGGPFLETDWQRELQLINLNVVSTVHASKQLLPQMVAAGHGRVLYTASVVSEMPGPFEAVYAASKAFVLSFSEALRNELKDTGVTITALQPGPTDTAFFERAGLSDTKVGQAKKDDPADVARDGIRALFAGDDKIVAGSFKNKLQVMLGNVTPDSALAQAHRKLAEPGSGEQDSNA